MLVVIKILVGGARHSPTHVVAVSLVCFTLKPGPTRFQWNSKVPHGIALLRELNPGPLAPEARIIPLDQAAGA